MNPIHRMFMARLVRALIVLAAVSALIAVVPAVAEASTLFSVQCIAGGIRFWEAGTAVVEVSFAQIAGPLGVAIASQQNQPVVIGPVYGVWALKSNELQVHRNADPDGTKLVVSANVCGPIPTTTPVLVGPAFGQALAFAQTSGAGSATAYAQVTGNQAQAYAQTTGSGVAGAYAQSSGYGYAPAPTLGARVHVVRAGENLYRIALRYGTTVRILAIINGIPDPNRIYVGQVIYLP